MWLGQIQKKKKKWSDLTAPSDSKQHYLVSVELRGTVIFLQYWHKFTRETVHSRSENASKRNTFARSSQSNNDAAFVA